MKLISILSHRIRIARLPATSGDSHSPYMPSHTFNHLRARIALLACALAFTLAPSLAMADATITMSPKNPPATMNFTVLPDGTVHGKKTLTVTITRKEPPSPILQACDKIQGIEIYADSDYSNRKAGWLYFYKHPLCNFTKTVTYYPFSEDNIRGRCLGNASHTIKNQIDIELWDTAGDANHLSIEFFWGNPITAHITCENGGSASAQPSPAANVRPVNACMLSGDWPVWETAPGRQVAIPFTLTANQGRSDIYQVSTPNNTGVTGTAVVSGYNVTMSLQGNGNGAQMQSFSGAFDRSCSTLTGQAVRSDAPFSLSATRRGGGNYTTQSVHSSRSRPAPAQARPRPAFAMPHVNTRVTPKWGTQLR